MNTQEFERILTDRLEQIKNTLSKKAKEYALGENALHNFKVAGRLKNETPAEALWGMAIKHLVSIEDLVKERLEPTGKMVDEKIGDMINYLILLEAVFKDDIIVKEKVSWSRANKNLKWRPIKLKTHRKKQNEKM